MINKEPVYIQINKAIRQLIISEQYSVGDKFLTERTICEKFGVSRSTANKSLSSLVSENILEFKKGIGTFIKSVPDRENFFSQFSDPVELLNLIETNFTIDIINKDFSFKNGFAEHKAPPAVIRRIKSSKTVIAIEMIYIMDHQEVFLKCLEDNISVNSIVQKENSLNIADTSERVSALISNNREMELFELDKETALLKVESECYNSNQEIILRTETLYNGEKISIEYLSPYKKARPSIL